MAKKQQPQDELPQQAALYDEDPNHTANTMNDVLSMVKNITNQGYDWEHPLIIRWEYPDEPFVFELVVVNDKAQLIHDPHEYGVH